MDFEFLKDRYDFELARRESLTSALTLPVGMWTALFLPCLGADVAAFVVALCFLALAYHGQNYGYLPSSMPASALRSSNSSIKANGWPVTGVCGSKAAIVR
jgi:hypothetical protein